jgi:hypothetical protein
MQLEVTHPAFKTQRLAVETAGCFTGPKLIVNGAIAIKHKGIYSVASDTGVQIPIKVKYNWLDPVPKIIVGDDSVELAPSLKWYEYVWGGIPIVLVFVGGALGGFVGALGACANGRIFRSNRDAYAKYGISALITFGAIFAFVILSTAFHLLVGTPQR